MPGIGLEIQGVVVSYQEIKICKKLSIIKYYFHLTIFEIRDHQNTIVHNVTNNKIRVCESN